MPNSAPITTSSNAPIVHGSEATKRRTATWVENGSPQIARGPDVANAPKGATVIDVEIFDLGGERSYRKVSLPRGAKVPSPRESATSTALVYVLKGKMNIKLGSVNATVAAGDAFRKIGAQENFYDVLEDTVFVETDAPTDHP